MESVGPTRQWRLQFEKGRGGLHYTVQHVFTVFPTNLPGNLQKPLPGDVALLIRDSYFCPSASDGGGIRVCCPTDGISPPARVQPALEERDGCGMQDPGIPAQCTLYNNCSPFIQLVRGKNIFFLKTRHIR